MRRGVLRARRTAIGVGACLALLLTDGVLVGCGRSSEPDDTSPDGGVSAASGGSGESATGGNANGGVGSTPNGGASGLANGSDDGGAGLGTGGTGTAATGGSGLGGTVGGSGTTGGVEPALGGTGGEPPETGGEPWGGADSGGASGCQDLCTQDAPACCSEEFRCVSSVSHCRIDVLAASVSISSEYADLERKVAASSGDVAVSVSDTELEWAAAEPPAAARIELRLNQHASSAKAAALASPQIHPFRVSCNEQTLFVGQTYLEYGAAVLRTPVLHVEQLADGIVELRLGAWQGAWAGFELTDGQLERERIDRTELRSALCARGVLNELQEP